VERERKPLMQRQPASKPGRAAASEEGHSGHGSESVRPHLRAMLKLKELLVPQFPPPEQSLATNPRRKQHRR
jgi:hypothetical protein